MKCKIIIIISILVCIIALAFSIYIIFNDFKEMEENNKDTENLVKDTIIVNEETEEKNIDWEYLKSVNQDIIAWIEIPNTIINYPILRDNNLYYLKHSYNKKYNSNGSIFTTNYKPFEEAETLLYGHNMKNGSMFSILDKYLEYDFLHTHQKFYIYTPDKNYECTIFSVYSIGINTEINNIKELNFDEKINYYKKSSNINIKVDKEISKIVKLSTCSYINARTSPTDQRYYIVAYLDTI